MVSARKSLSPVVAVLLCGGAGTPAPVGAQAAAQPRQPADPYAEGLRELEGHVNDGLKRGRIPRTTTGFFKDAYTWVEGFERPLAYFRRAFESNPGGVMRVKTFLDIGGRRLSRQQLTDAGIEYVGAAVALHPKDAAARGMPGDFLARKGRLEEAAGQKKN